MDEIISQSQTKDRRRIAWALTGGSTKKLVKSGEFNGLPTAISLSTQPGVIVTDSEGVKKATCEYLKKLYT